MQIAFKALKARAAAVGKGGCSYAAIAEHEETSLMSVISRQATCQALSSLPEDLSVTTEEQFMHLYNTCL
jgi:hypothetical protein